MIRAVHLTNKEGVQEDPPKKSSQDGTRFLCCRCSHSWKYDRLGWQTYHRDSSSGECQKDQVTHAENPGEDRLLGSDVQ